MSARLTAVVLTKLGDVSTVVKTLVEALNDVLQILDATGSIDSSLVYVGGAQTLAKFFYDRNDHGRGEVLSLAAEFAAEGRAEGEEYVRRNTDSMFGWTWRSSRISAELLCPWSTAGPKEEASLATLPAAGTEATAAPPPAAPACCARRATKRA